LALTVLLKLELAIRIERQPGRKLALISPPHEKIAL